MSLEDDQLPRACGAHEQYDATCERCHMQNCGEPYCIEHRDDFDPPPDDDELEQFGRPADWDEPVDSLSELQEQITQQIIDLPRVEIEPEWPRQAVAVGIATALYGAAIVAGPPILVGHYAAVVYNILRPRRRRMHLRVVLPKPDLYSSLSQPAEEWDRLEYDDLGDAAFDPLRL